jgi:hypothetical protein
VANDINYTFFRKEQFIRIVVNGGDFNHKNEFVKKDKDSPLKILILTVSNDIYIWYDDIQQFVKWVHI